MRTTPRFLLLAAAAAWPAISAAVTVTGEAPIVETASASISTVVTRELIMQLPASRRLDDLLTMSLTPGQAVADPVPGVNRISIKMPRDQFTLPDGTMVDFGNGNELPLGSLYTFHARPSDRSLEIMIRLPGDKKPVVRQTIKLPIVNPAPAFDFPSLPPNHFETPPVGLLGHVHVIRGALSGDGGKTKIRIGEQMLKIVSENPRSVFFELPDNLRPGNFRISLEDGGRRVELPIILMDLAMSADQLTLKRGQSTKFHVTISGPESWVDAAWRAGIPSDLCDVAALAKRFPSFRPPAAGSEGFLVFWITNLSPSVISIDEFARPLSKSHFAKGAFTYDGSVYATADGGFGIHGEVQAFIAPASGESVPIPPDQKK